MADQLLNSSIEFFVSQVVLPCPRAKSMAMFTLQSFTEYFKSTVPAPCSLRGQSGAPSAGFRLATSREIACFLCAGAA